MIEHSRVMQIKKSRQPQWVPNHQVICLHHFIRKVLQSIRKLTLNILYKFIVQKHTHKTKPNKKRERNNQSKYQKISLAQQKQRKVEYNDGESIYTLIVYTYDTGNCFINNVLISDINKMTVRIDENKKVKIKSL